MASSRIFSDLDIDFTMHPITHDVSLKTRENSIVQSVKNIVNTNYSERLFNPTFGSNLRALLFNPADALTASLIQNEIVNMITNFEPRVSIDSLQVQADLDHDGFNVSLRFYVLNSIKPTNVVLFLNRLR